jgi:hypothetical protein
MIQGAFFKETDKSIIASTAKDVLDEQLAYKPAQGQKKDEYGVE